ncbi:MAG: protein kinase [Candidatus Brocadiae bacterium]|nr:protein kinase [Candidatus Brocadiia bacterium]
MEARLVVSQGGKIIENFLLDKEQKTTIGRHPDSTLCFQDSKISARHCFIEPKGNYFYIIDQNSTNGTYINDSKIRIRRLYEGDCIKCGEITLRFEWIHDEQSDQDVVILDLKQEDSLGSKKTATLESVKEKKYRIGDYIILKKIGQGGIGEVFKAEHVTELDVPVAIKVLTPTAQQNKTLVERFLREAKACIYLEHPRLVKVFEIGTYNNRPYFVMEYLEGETLDRFIKKHGAFSVKNTLKIAGHIAHGLVYAHAHNIIHRDLKPSNILLEEPAHNVKLIDLGLAKMLDESRLTVTHHLIGTPRYMAPEQMLNPNEIDFRVDLYSLGCIMYHMLTGIAPYAEILSDNRSALLRYMYSKRPLPLEKMVDIPSDVKSLVNKAMAKKKEDRFSDAREMFETIYSMLKKNSISQ